ncbi:protein involved in polysaccharide export, contains SLBB domain of the beta-grasp fold [Prevotellaceae bacterium HUN156]|nr:protein involved in polysaccharide export, contains SLBB domain of the beta-grasp fold [Prevotellaceae bacterium HUN156]
MKRIYLIFFLLVCCMIVTNAQNSNGGSTGGNASSSSASVSDGQAVRSALSQKRSGASESQIATSLLKQGATPAQLQRLRGQYANQINKAGMSNAVDNGLRQAIDRMRTNNETGEPAVADATLGDDEILLLAGEDEEDEDQEIKAGKGGISHKQVFGRNIFNNPNLTFAPNMNIATPQNYVLGPGDVLVVDIYGGSQESQKLTVSPEGDVYVPEFGPIQVSGLQIATAQSRIRSRLGKYFQGSSIRVTLAQTRSIQINVLGEVRVPGTYTLSSLSTVYHALYRAGGISNLGTLRNIKLYRQGRLVTVVDVYEFIFNGRLAGNVRLEDNDVIQVGTYDCLVDVDGHVKRPMTYELRQGETLSTLLKYSGGFSSDAYKNTVRVMRNSDKLKNVFNIDEFDFSSFGLRDGDVVSIEAISDLYDNMVQVNGAISRPGMYQLGEKVYSVKSLIERADGMIPEAMTNRAVLRRLKPNRTQEVLSINLEGIMAGTEPDVPLQNEDVLFIPTIPEHQNLRTISIMGEVVFPGTYEYADSMTIENFILQAGGLTDAASVNKVDVSRTPHDPHATSAGMDLKQTYTFTIDENFKFEKDKDFVLQPFDIVQVRKSPVYQDPITVSVGGEVLYRGDYTMERKNMRLSDLVKAAGGVIDGADIRGARLTRKMNEDERARIRSIIRMARQTSDSSDSISLSKLAVRTTYPVGIHLDEALANPGTTKDIELMDGDELIIPRFNHTVRISGDVHTPNTVAFEEGKGYKYYIEQAGGFGDRAKKRSAYIVYQNGTMAIAKKAKIEPGCEIIVPSKVKKEGSNVTQWLGVGTSLASLATMIATIANLTK